MIIGSQVKLNLVPSGVMPVVYINQGDAGYDKEFLIYNGDSPYNVPSGVSATIRGTKADGYGVTEAATVTTGSNLVTVTITEQMVAAAGKNVYELVFVDADGLRVASINMVWAVKKDALGDSVISDSDLDYASTVMNQLQSVQAFKNQLDTNTTDIESNADDIAAERTARIAADGALQNNINAEASTRATQDAVLSARMDTFSSLPSGSTAGDAELLDIRVKADGAAAASAGDAVREQITTLGNDLDAIGLVKYAIAGSATQPNITVQQWGDGIVNINGSSGSSFYVLLSDTPAAITNWTAVPRNIHLQAGKIYTFTVIKLSGTAANPANVSLGIGNENTIGVLTSLLNITANGGSASLEVAEDMDVFVYAYIRYSTSTSNLKFQVILTEKDNAITTNDLSAQILSLINNSAEEIDVDVETELTGDTVMRGSDGKITTGVGAGYKVTGLIPVTANDQFSFKCDLNYGNYFYRFYTNEQVYGFGGEKAGDSGTFTTYDGTITVPSGANYVRFGFYYDPANNHDYTLSRKEKVFAAGALTEPLWSELDERYYREADWTGKKWVVVGDSLTEVNNTASVKYYNIIANKTGITVLNYGIGGTGYGNTGSGATNFAQRVLTLANVDCDLITIFGSFNDMGLELGTADDTGTDTLGGWMNTTFDNLYATKPFVSVGVILPTPWWGRSPDGSTEGRLKAVHYCDMLLEICRRRSIPVLDMFHNSNFHPNESNFREEFFANADGVHPNNAGHAKMAPMFFQFLKKLIEL